MFSSISNSIQETDIIAQRLLASLQPQKNQATILTLQGDLGSGKTAFTKILAQHLGITETLISPTFVIAKYYDVPEQGEKVLEQQKSFPWKQLIHIDAYRLESGEDLHKLGFDYEFDKPENLVVIEWPEKIADILHHRKVVRVEFEFIDENKRKISFDI